MFSLTCVNWFVLWKEQLYCFSIFRSSINYSSKPGSWKIVDNLVLFVEIASTQCTRTPKAFTGAAKCWCGRVQSAASACQSVFLCGAGFPFSPAAVENFSWDQSQNGNSSQIVCRLGARLASQTRSVTYQTVRGIHESGICAIDRSRLWCTGAFGKEQSRREILCFQTRAFPIPQVECNHYRVSVYQWEGGVCVCGGGGVQQHVLGWAAPWGPTRDPRRRCCQSPRRRATSRSHPGGAIQWLLKALPSAAVLKFRLVRFSATVHVRWVRATRGCPWERGTCAHRVPLLRQRPRAASSEAPLQGTLPSRPLLLHPRRCCEYSNLRKPPLKKRILLAPPWTCAWECACLHSCCVRVHMREHGAKKTTLARGMRGWGEQEQR